MRCHLFQCPGKDSMIVWEVMIQNKLFLGFWINDTHSFHRIFFPRLSSQEILGR